MSSKTEIAFPIPGLKNRLYLYLQRSVGHILIYPFTSLIVVLMRYFRGYQIQGMKELRKEFTEITREKKPLIICMNHLTFIDSALLIWALSSNLNYLLNFRRFSWNLPAGDFFKKKFIFRVVAYLAKCIFIHRDKSKEHKNEILGLCHYLLNKGEIVTIFPEGKRSRLGLFDTDHLTFGVGKLLEANPSCRVLCIYLRSDTQARFSNYPPKNSHFKILSKLITPATEKTGRESYLDLVRQIGESIKGLEHQYFSERGITAESILNQKRKTALITGASEGIGRALATEFAADGYQLVLVARNAKRLEELAKECKSKYGTPSTVICADLSETSAVENIYSILSEKNIQVDALVNNAGFGIHGEFQNTNAEEEARLLNTQTHSILFLTKKLLPHMIEQGSGKILNVASVYSFSPVPFQSVYSACKAFMLSFSESLAAELAPKGIQVSVLCPGVTKTLFRTRAGIKEKNVGMTSSQVAHAAYRGLKRGNRVIVPGKINRLYVEVFRHLSGKMASRLMIRINGLRGVNAT